MYVIYMVLSDLSSTHLANVQDGADSCDAPYAPYLAADKNKHLPEYCECRMWEGAHHWLWRLRSPLTDDEIKKLKTYNCKSDSKSECHPTHCEKLKWARSSAFIRWPGVILKENLDKDPGGKTPLEYIQMMMDEWNKPNVIKDFCFKDDNIKITKICNKETLGDEYDPAAKTYCRSDAGQMDTWCSCYNISKDVCFKKPDAAGCAEKKEHFDSLVEATPSGFRDGWNGRETCFGGVCEGDKYMAEEGFKGCTDPLNICDKDIEPSNVTKSIVEESCKIEEEEWNAETAGTAGTAGTTGTTGTTGTIPTSDNTQLKLAGVGSSVCLIIILILILR